VTATIADVRAGLADAVLASGLERCQPYLLDLVNPPEAHIGKGPMDPNFVFTNAKSAYAFRITLFMPRAPAEASQAAIDEYCEVNGERSIRAAIANGANWPDNLVDYAKVTQISEVFVSDRSDGSQYLAVNIDVEVVW
jgi:hypothetical protein